MMAWGKSNWDLTGSCMSLKTEEPNIIVVETPNEATPTFSLIQNPINPTTGQPIRTGLGISDFVQSDVFIGELLASDTLCQAVGAEVAFNLPNVGYTYQWFNDANPGIVIFEEADYSFTMGNLPVALTVLATDTGGLVTEINFLVNPQPEVKAGPI